MRPRSRSILVATLLATNVAASGVTADAIAPTVPYAADPTFGGGDGLVTVDLGGFDGCPPGFDSTQSTRCGIALQSDGRILAVATATGATLDLLVSRFLGDGTPDPSFGAGGSVVVDLGTDEKGPDIAIDSVGRIVVVGQSSAAGTSRSLVVRLLADGSLDPGFGAGGAVFVQVGNDDHGFARTVAIGAGDTITFGGMTAPSGFSFLVARLTSDGALDPTFGTGGIRVDSPQGGETTEATAMRPNGRIVAVGSSYLGSDTAMTFEVGVDGGLFASWGICRYRNVQVAGATTGGTYGVIIDPDGRTVAVGYSSVGLGSGRLFSVRLLPDSTIDPTFGTAGVVHLELGGPDAFSVATGVARGTDGACT